MENAIEKNACESNEEKTDERLLSKAMEASVRFLERHDYEVLDPDYDQDGERLVVARDEDGAIVFVNVAVNALEASDLPEEDRTHGKRSRLERAGAKWLTENVPESDVAIRFDYISMLLVSADRVFLRHHINAFGSDWPE